MPETIAKVEDFSITEFVSIEAYSRKTGLLDFIISEPQDLTLTGGENSTNNTGKNGRTILIKKSNKSLTGSGTNGVVNARLMAAQTGGDYTTGTYKVKKSEFATVGATNKIVTEDTAIGTAGAEIGEIKVLNDNNSVAEVYTQATTADATHFAYNPTTKEITLPIDNTEPVIEEDTKVLFAYTREVAGTKITDPSDKFSDVCELWIHCWGTDACDRAYYVSIYIPRCSFTGEFDLALGGDQTVQNFNFTALADTCKSTGNLFELIVRADEKTA